MSVMLYFRSVSFLSILVGSLFAIQNNGYAATWDPASTDFSGNKGKTIYVSKLGDNTNGTSWKKAFHTIQAALLAVPDDQGGHTIIVRPDTYSEACLYPAHKGAKGSYNLILGDYDGSLGSGATGWALIDTSMPGVAVRPDNMGYKIVESDQPESGFKSIDYWSTVLVGSGPASVEPAKRLFSSISWDRWIIRNFYTSGSDGGFFWDIGGSEKDAAPQGFTVIVEDCAAIARAFAGGVCYPAVRPDEPSMFRRSYFMALDYIGDSAAVLIGGWEKSIPEKPHLILEDCTLVHPASPLGMSFANNCARVKMIACRLISLMFTQHEMGGDKTAAGIIRSTRYDTADRRLHVDLENSILIGYSVFTPNPAAAPVTYTVKGKVKAYVHYRRPTPKEFERLGNWPTDLFSRIAPPPAPRPK